MSRILGCNSRGYPSEDGRIVEVKTVLVEGDIQDYAAYSGSGEKEWVAAHGDKVSFAEAQVHFCGQLVESKYRD